MLCGNFKEENISATIKEVRESAKEYRSLFTECSIYIEKIAKGSLKTKLLNRAGAVEKVMGKFIGKIPKVKEGYVDIRRTACAYRSPRHHSVIHRHPYGRNRMKSR